MKFKTLFVALGLSFLAAGSLASSDMIGQKAPDFALKSSTGENLRLSEYRGEVVMLNFWATWCGPCRQEMPLLDDLYNRYERVGFKLLGVNIDFPILFDASKDVSKLYEVNAMPVTVILDREGNVRYVHKGYKPGYEEKYLNEVRALLRE